MHDCQTSITLRLSYHSYSPIYTSQCQLEIPVKGHKGMKQMGCTISVDKFVPRKILSAAVSIALPWSLSNVISFFPFRQALWGPAILPPHHPARAHWLWDGGRAAVRLCPGLRHGQQGEGVHTALRQLRGVVWAGPGLCQRWAHPALGASCWENTTPSSPTTWLQDCRVTACSPSEGRSQRVS